MNYKTHMMQNMFISVHNKKQGRIKAYTVIEEKEGGMPMIDTSSIYNKRIH